MLYILSWFGEWGLVLVFNSFGVMMGVLSNWYCILTTVSSHSIKKVTVLVSITFLFLATNKLLVLNFGLVSFRFFLSSPILQVLLPEHFHSLLSIIVTCSHSSRNRRLRSTHIDTILLLLVMMLWTRIIMIDGLLLGLGLTLWLVLVDALPGCLIAR